MRSSAHHSSQVSNIRISICHDGDRSFIILVELRRFYITNMANWHQTDPSKQIPLASYL